MLPLHFSFREFSACKNATVFQSVGESEFPKLMILTEEKKANSRNAGRESAPNYKRYKKRIFFCLRSLRRSSLLGVKIVVVVAAAVAAAAAAAAVTLGRKEKQGSVEAQT